MSSLTSDKNTHERGTHGIYSVSGFSTFGPEFDLHESIRIHLNNIVE